MTSKNKGKKRNGYFSIQRPVYEKLRDKNINLAKCYVECCNEARYKKGSWTNPQSLEEIPLNYGQFVFGRFEFAKRIGVEPNSTYRYIKKLKELGIIGVENHNHQFSIITVYWLEQVYEEYAKKNSDNEADEWLNEIT